MKIRSVLVAGMLAITLAAPAFGQQPPTLYKRLGGYDAIVAVSDDFLARLSTDPQFTKFFAGHSTDSIRRLRQRRCFSGMGRPAMTLRVSMKRSFSANPVSEVKP